MIDKEKVLTGLECCAMNGNGCRQCPYNKDCDEMPDYGNAYLCSDALELLKEQQETITSLQGTICKLNAALAEQSEQKFFVDSNGKITPLPIQKHGHWQNDKYGNILCSVCGGLAVKTMTGSLFDSHPATYLSDYCPNCGAKMDGEATQDGVQ